jgi:hypothetical protein
MQYRAAAFGLAIIAVLTAGMVAFAMNEALGGPLLLPAVAAYFLFNFGYVFAVLKGRLRTNGARLGLGAVCLNFLAMLLSSFTAVWTALSLCAVGSALIGAFTLLKEAKCAAAPAAPTK